MSGYGAPVIERPRSQRSAADSSLPRRPANNDPTGSAPSAVKLILAEHVRDRDIAQLVTKCRTHPTEHLVVIVKQLGEIDLCAQVRAPVDEIRDQPNVVPGDRRCVGG